MPDKAVSAAENGYSQPARLCARGHINIHNLNAVGKQHSALRSKLNTYAVPFSVSGYTRGRLGKSLFPRSR